MGDFCLASELVSPSTSPESSSSSSQEQHKRQPDEDGQQKQHIESKGQQQQQQQQRKRFQHEQDEQTDRPELRNQLQCDEDPGVQLSPESPPIESLEPRDESLVESLLLEPRTILGFDERPLGAASVDSFDSWAAQPVLPNSKDPSTTYMTNGAVIFTNFPGNRVYGSPYAAQQPPDLQVQQHRQFQRQSQKHLQNRQQQDLQAHYPQQQQQDLQPHYQQQQQQQQQQHSQMSPYQQQQRLNNRQSLQQQQMNRTSPVGSQPCFGLQQFPGPLSQQQQHQEAMKAAVSAWSQPWVAWSSGGGGSGSNNSAGDSGGCVGGMTSLAPQLVRRGLQPAYSMVSPPGLPAMGAVVSSLEKNYQVYGGGGGGGGGVIGQPKFGRSLYGKGCWVDDNAYTSDGNTNTLLPFQLHDRGRIFDPMSMHSLENSLVDIMRSENDHLKDEITASFRRFGVLVVDWPHKAESKSYFPPKGYAFLLFQDESSVQALIEACIKEDDKLYLCVSSPTIKDKPVQIRPWNLSDSDFVMDGSQPLDPRKTIFVGGVPRPLRAVELALIMERLYGGVCYAGIDTDPELRYPKGAGRVAFSRQQSYIAAISARFVQLQHGDIDKRVEVKPYVLDDQMCDECQGARCQGKFAPFFCANVTCLQYYCEGCWSAIHSGGGREFHKPLVKEGADRPRPPAFRWC
uniref:cytoplasmic polyadenylation element-binding protein 2-like isoform X2 n=1 Tax=Myxine glutinosa TaxID=7769 RepID=UPI00358E5FB9